MLWALIFIGYYLGDKQKGKYEIEWWTKRLNGLYLKDWWKISSLMVERAFQP